MHNEGITASSRQRQHHGTFVIAASNVADRVCNDKRWLTTRAPAELEVMGDTGMRCGTHIPLLPQITVISLVHTFGFIMLFLSSLFFSYSLLPTKAWNSFPRIS